MQRECSAVFGVSEGEKKVDGGKRKYTLKTNTVYHVRITGGKERKEEAMKKVRHRDRFDTSFC